ncbi:TauD/TfdA family dioxygenase [Micromonospora peucetia]|uniref:TauD/TfdA family dioxygenase n=1 Tax=Micromonospora peucetia TaxID=47871 RepID=A0A1C6VWK9_9ACTN|nr:TauD/TfdA family dioxygenase [Micromonospora peucetia]MCX4387880.1 TauD/TfdA family dioxygenase [Micromonospora peucetia]WSA31412.1 TauD/TfdA family dioxygenase [Micromonospora peucetia]SCL70749.1 Taurine dioxygenase, alpha-ketoglutarate-dependent [Micromonospora peucetia]
MNEHASWKPLEITPESAGCAPSADGLVGHLRELNLAEVLTAEKALVFRGFGVRPETLDPVMDLLLPRRLAYVHGNSPRTKVGRNVYTSTEYPARYTISMHNELSYAAQWPARLLFFCQIAAETGGATPVVDAELWLNSLDPQLRADFAGGLRYQQNLHDGMGLGKSWRDTFETDSRDEVEEFLAGAGATWEWTADGLRVIQLRPATLRHPVTGVEVWFNQADQWHPAGLDDDIARVMTQVMGPDELPQSVTFADGSPIPDEYVTQIRDRGLEAAVDVDWRVGDLLLIDNVLTAHGRRPYTGDRRVLVAMSD